MHPQRSPDGFICSYPKTGRTWLRFALHHYLSDILELGLETKFTTLFSLLPNDGGGPNRGPEAFAFSDRPEIPLIVSSHRRRGPEHEGTPTVLLVRSPLDTLVSLWFHLSRHHGNDVGDLDAWAAERAGDLAAHLDSWAPRVGQEVLPTSYETMSASMQGTLSAAIRHLGVDLDPAAVQRAVDAADFDRMMQAEETEGIPDHEYDMTDPEARRVRRGAIGGWTDYLSDSTAHQVVEVLDDRLGNVSRELLDRLCPSWRPK
jgi:hypothetical protein